MIKLSGNLHADFDKVFEAYTKQKDRKNKKTSMRVKFLKKMRS